MGPRGGHLVSLLRKLLAQGMRLFKTDQSVLSNRMWPYHPLGIRWASLSTGFSGSGPASARVSNRDTRANRRVAMVLLGRDSGKCGVQGE